MRQLCLIPKTKIKVEHGGSLNFRKRNCQRPLSPKKVVHLVLKSQSEISLYENREFILKTIRRQAELSHVRIYDLSVQHDHIHHAIYFLERKHYCAFIRAVTGLLARKFGRGLWKYRPFTRVVEWGRSYQKLKAYIWQNELEVTGMIPYQRRPHRARRPKIISN